MSYYSCTDVPSALGELLKDGCPLCTVPCVLYVWRECRWTYACGTEVTYDGRAGKVIAVAGMGCIAYAWAGGLPQYKDHGGAL